jgi:glycosyltransferase involved in cell wall biosynthesis
MNVLSFSYCFPNVHRPRWGVFVAQRLAALARRPEVSLQVVAPVPVFPLVTRLRAQMPPKTDTRMNLPVHHPRFFYVPGLLKDHDGAFYARGLHRWLRRYIHESSRPDLLDAHFAWPDGVGVATLARQMNIPYSITLRGKIYPCLDQPAQKRQVTAVLQQAGAVISVSAPMAEEAIALGAPRERVHVIPNGIDLDRFQLTDRLEARQELGLPEQGRLLVTVAHMGPRKGHREAVTALADLPDDVQLVLVGGERHAGRDVRDLRQLADQLGVAGRVHFAGSQPYETIPRYFAAADASVLVSYREGCPNVVLESLAAGRPVVASNVGAVPDLVEPGRNGQLVAPRDPGATADAIRKVLEMDASPEDIRSSPVVRSWDAVAEDVHRVFEGVCTRVLTADGQDLKPQAMEVR